MLCYHNCCELGQRIQRMPNSDCSALMAKAVPMPPPNMAGTACARAARQRQHAAERREHAHHNAGGGEHREALCVVQQTKGSIMCQSTCQSSAARRCTHADAVAAGAAACDAAAEHQRQAAGVGQARVQPLGSAGGVRLGRRKRGAGDAAHLRAAAAMRFRRGMRRTGACLGRRVHAPRTQPATSWRGRAWPRGPRARARRARSIRRR